MKPIPTLLQEEGEKGGLKIDFARPFSRDGN